MVNGVVSIAPAGGNTQQGCTSCGDRSRRDALRRWLPQRFVAGSENQFAANAIATVLAEPIPAEGAAGYNPMVVYGPSGCGKTLLVQELAETWRRHHKALPVVFKPAVEFAQEFQEAVDAQDVEQFRHVYRNAGLLILEDITRLAGKKAVERELRETIDAVVCNCRRLVITASSVPGQWPNICTALQARLVAGLGVQVVYPSQASRLAIIVQWAGQRKMNLTATAAELLAAGLEGPAAKLSGALHQLDCATVADQKTGAPIGSAAIKRFLIDRHAPRQPELREIAAATARAFSLKVGQLRSRSQARGVVTARDAAMYVARRLTHHSLQQIGHYFGGRDHTTVLHGCRKTETMLSSEPDVQRAVEQVQQTLLWKSNA